MSKHLTLVVASLMTIGSQVSAADTYQCSGTVGNAYDPWKPEYEVYANRTVTFAIQCNLWQRYAEGQKNCGANMNGQAMFGYYLGSGITEVFEFHPNNTAGVGHFDFSTLTLAFPVEPSSTESQRWFNGSCTKS